MKLTAWLAMAALACAAWCCAADEEGKARKEAWNAEAGFVAHEWGAIVIDARHPYGPGEMSDDLRGTPAWRGEPGVAAMPAGKGKPVLFLYAAHDMEIDVTVESTDGDLLFSWPTPMADRRETHSDDPWAAMGSDTFQWKKLKLSAVGEASNVKLTPIADAGHWWNDCRAVEASQVVSGGDNYAEAEQFLFYDGTSSLAPKVAFDRSGDTVTVRNNQGGDMRDVFVVSRPAAADEAAWGYLECVKAGEELTVQLQSAKPFEERFLRSSMDAGLYRKEAEAFWAAWKKQFYSNDGLRVVYRLSAAEMDKLMPLAIEPKPDSTVRVNWVCLGK